MIVVELDQEETKVQHLLRELKQLHDQLAPRILQLTQELADLQYPLQQLEREVKEEVIKGGVSVKTQWADATYVREGVRVKWDRHKLDGYMAAHPEIKGFRSESRVKAHVRLRVK
jgi:hypothetical protein